MITQLTDKAIACTIPPEGNINNSYLWGYTNQWWVRFTEMTSPGKFITREIKLPEGTWAIEGVGDKLTEDQWREVVEWFSDYEVYSNSGYLDYAHPQAEATAKTALESGLSLLKSKNLAPETTLILIKQ